MAEGGGERGAASGRGATAPGVGPPSAPGVPSSGRRAAAEEVTQEPVDFDALSAALGGVTHPTAARGSQPPEGHDSEGRSSASYASSRPHSVPPARVTSDADPNMPAVIVAADDTVPSSPPLNMTVPLGTPAPPIHHIRPDSAPAYSTPMPHPIAAPVSSPPFTPPQPFPVARGGNLHATMRMAERPRRPRAMTVVVRPRGPSTAQKLVAFMAMLVLVTACGIAVIIWRKPGWLGLVPDAPPEPATAPSVLPTTTATAEPAPLPTTNAPAPTATPVVPTASPSSLPTARPTTSPRAPKRSAPKPGSLPASPY